MLVSIQIVFPALTKYKLVIAGSNNDGAGGNIPISVIDENNNCLFQVQQMGGNDAGSTTHIHNNGDLSLGSYPEYTTTTPIVPLDARKEGVYSGVWPVNDRVLAILGRSTGTGNDRGRIAIGGRL